MVGTAEPFFCKHEDCPLSLVADLPRLKIINRKSEVPPEAKAEYNTRFRIPLLRIMESSSELPVEMLLSLHQL